MLGPHARKNPHRTLIRIRILPVQLLTRSPRQQLGHAFKGGLQIFLATEQHTACSAKSGTHPFGEIGDLLKAHHRVPMNDIRKRYCGKKEPVKKISKEKKIQQEARLTPGDGIQPPELHLQPLRLEVGLSPGPG